MLVPLWIGCIGGGLAIATIGANQLPARKGIHRSETSFDKLNPLDGVAPGRVFVLFGPLWGGPTRFLWIPEFLRRFGTVVMVHPGAFPDLAPVETLAYLKREGLLLGHTVHVHGFSKGAIELAGFCHLLWPNGILDTESSLLLYDPAGDPAAVKWPHPRFLPAWILPRVLRLLHPGLVAGIGWYVFWSIQIFRAKRHRRPADQRHAEWCRRMHPGTAIRGARALMQEIGLRTGEFGGFGCKRIFRHKEDNLLSTSELWPRVLNAKPDDVIMLPSRGHGDFDNHRLRIQEELISMYAPTA